MTKKEVMAQHLEYAYKAMLEEYSNTKSKKAFEAIHYLRKFIENLDCDNDYREVTAFYFDKNTD